MCFVLFVSEAAVSRPGEFNFACFQLRERTAHQGKPVVDIKRYVGCPNEAGRLISMVQDVNEFDIIHITKLEFYGYHGVPDAEQEIGHRYRADISLHIKARHAVVTDRLADTVDYGAVAALISKIGATDKCRLVETLAERMAAAIFEQHAGVIAIRLVLTKLLPPVGVIAESVGVEIFRTREDRRDNLIPPHG